MKIINLAERQIRSNSQFSMEHPFFREYLSQFNSNINFKTDAGRLMQAYHLHDVSKAVRVLKTFAEEMLSQIRKNYLDNIDFDIIIFFGDCSFDGHGMLIDGNPYVFFDLNAIIPRLDVYNFRAFMTHEMVHAIHYCLNPDFYQKNHHTIEEKYLKLLIAEGIATHLSSVISKEKMKDVYWFGYIREDQVLEWVRN